MRETY